MPPPTFDSGQGPVGFGLLPGDSQTWVTAGGVPFGLTSFWTAQALSPPGGAVEVTHVYHNTTDAGLIQRNVVVLNRGQNPVDYVLIWVLAQTL